MLSSLFHSKLLPFLALFAPSLWLSALNYIPTQSAEKGSGLIVIRNHSAELINQPKLKPNHCCWNTSWTKGFDNPDKRPNKGRNHWFVTRLPELKRSWNDAETRLKIDIQLKGKVERLKASETKKPSVRFFDKELTLRNQDFQIFRNIRNLISRDICFKKVQYCLLKFLHIKAAAFRILYKFERVESVLSVFNVQIDEKSVCVQSPKLTRKI